MTDINKPVTAENLPESMQAVRVMRYEYGDGDGFVELQELPLPEFGDDEVLIKVKGCAICGSDIGFYKGLFKVHSEPPITLGHEFCGEVAGIGKNAKGLALGDRVTCELQVGYCGQCKLCHSGYTHLCAHKKAPGLSLQGAYAQYITMPANMAHKIKGNVSFKAAACIEPAAVVATALLERCPVKVGDVAVVFGAGPLGLVAIQLAKITGADKVIVVEPFNKMRAEMAKKLGADYVVEDPDEDVKKLVDDMTDGFGCDLVIDCSGVEAALNTSIDILHKNGRICYIGVPKHPVTINMTQLVVKAISLISSYASSSSSWDTVISLLESGKLDLDTIVTHTFRLEDYREAFDTLMASKAIKVVFAPNEPIE